MLESIYIKVDGREFITIKLTYTSTVAELRITLSKDDRLPCNTYFLDTRGYHIYEKDEHTYKIKQLLHENNVIQMQTDTSTPQKNTTKGLLSVQTQARTAITRSFVSINSELWSIFGWLWLILFKPAIIITSICLLTYYGYTKLVCRHGHFLPLVTMYCPAAQLEFTSIPPISELAENSVSLADTLMSADVSAPMRVIQAKISLIEIRSRIIYSDIDINVRNKLGEQMLELQQLAQIGADQLTIMLVSFGGTLDKLRMYTQFALEELSEVINPQIRRRNNDPLQIGYSEREASDKLTKSFDDYMTAISGQIDKILLKAQQASMSLESIKEKFEAIQELNFKGKHISQSRIDQLKHGSFWSRLFDEGKLGIVKHERNLEKLDGFIDFVNKASINVNDIIIKLKSFKQDAEDLKQTGVLLQVSSVPVNRHAQLLNMALKRLTKSKEKFEGKMKQLSQQSEV